MKNVEQVRTITIRVMQHSLQRLRGLLSTLPESTELVDALREKSGERVLASVTDTVLAELGHSALVDADDSQSHTRRAVRRMTRGG